MLSKDAKVLIVDDSKFMRIALRKLFGGLGYSNLVEAEDGLDGLEKYRDEQPDLILFDIVMPNMKGDEALAKIRSEDTATPVIMFSSFVKDEQVEICQSLGINGFLAKPLSAESGRDLEGLLSQL